jgi:hypothetical protein
MVVGATPMTRRFPPPWSVEEQSACFVVERGIQRLRLVVVALQSAS